MNKSLEKHTDKSLSSRWQNINSCEKRVGTIPPQNQFYRKLSRNWIRARHGDLAQQNCIHEICSTILNP